MSSNEILTDTQVRTIRERMAKEERKRGQPLSRVARLAIVLRTMGAEVITHPSEDPDCKRSETHATTKGLV